MSQEIKEPDIDGCFGTVFAIVVVIGFLFLVFMSFLVGIMDQSGYIFVGVLAVLFVMFYVTVAIGADFEDQANPYARLVYSGGIYLAVCLLFCLSFGEIRMIIGGFLLLLGLIIFPYALEGIAAKNKPVRHFSTRLLVIGLFVIINGFLLWAYVVGYKRFYDWMKSDASLDFIDHLLGGDGSYEGGEGILIGVTILIIIFSVVVPVATLWLAKPYRKIWDMITQPFVGPDIKTIEQSEEAYPVLGSPAGLDVPQGMEIEEEAEETVEAEPEPEPVTVWDVANLFLADPERSDADVRTELGKVPSDLIRDGAVEAMKMFLNREKYGAARRLLNYQNVDEHKLLPVIIALDEFETSGELALTPQTYKIILDDGETAYEKLPCNWQKIHTYLGPLQDEIEQSDILDIGNLYITDHRVFFVGAKGSETVRLADIAYIDHKEDALQFYRDEGLSEIFAFPTPHHATYAILVIEALMADS